ncbi:glycerate 2-kinase [Candidatus Vecturithrix granuli]|uniref:Glycerate 2-kinase n=1 Tax=Vecturithrix granuli TaxID=1499967 RepID=A0A081CAX9_VECG1|nr:glycerate 2-kinase [Candidatus Vecturithrix granuli]
MGRYEVLRQHAIEIFYAGLRAVDPNDAIQRHVSCEGTILHVGSQQYDLDAFRHIYVVGGGKAGASMASAVENLLGERVTQGWVNVKYEHLAPTRTIHIHEAGHPVPDEAGVRGTQEIVHLLETATEQDLVICLISGGGSALLPAPVAGITLQQKQAVTKLLLHCGATINEINTIRKHISAIKGGQLARVAAPATLVTLILSDVIGDPLDTIASGPTVPDSQTFTDCLNILNKYEIEAQIPMPVLQRLQQGAQGEIADTPKAGDPIFRNVQNLIIASNVLAARAAEEKARALHYNPMLLSTFVEGETREVAKVHAAILKEILHSGHPLTAPACIISGGETTVSIQGDGLGGRNQEFVLAAAREIEGLSNVVILSAGTDGTDGPTDAAGAIADGDTVQRAQEKSLDPLAFLKNNDSYHFFEALGDLIKTGPTNTNVMDLRILLAG